MPTSSVDNDAVHRATLASSPRDFREAVEARRVLRVQVNEAEDACTAIRVAMPPLGQVCAGGPDARVVVKHAAALVDLVELRVDEPHGVADRQRLAAPALRDV